MKISTSILDCENRKDAVFELNKTRSSYIHIDVMDGVFVPRSCFMDIEELKEISRISKYPMDIHLMMKHPREYIDKLRDMNIAFITIHFEIDEDIKELASMIRNFGYKVGLSMKPGTDIKRIEPYLDFIDMVLVMSVEPGMGGQMFMESTVARVKILKELIDHYGKNILIEVDGGINNETICKLEDVDVAVVGSYIVKSNNYSKKIEELFSSCHIENNEIAMDVKKIRKRNFMYIVLAAIIIIFLFSFLLEVILNKHF